MIWKFLAALIGVALVVGALVATKIEQFRTMAEAGASMVPPPEVITAAAVSESQWERTLWTTGSLSPVQGVVIAAETPGKVARIAFESGRSVAAGDVLVELATSTERADLRAARAAAALAKANLARVGELRKNNNTSPAELDAAKAQYEEAQARVQSMQTVIDKKSIRAPFAGQLGMREIDLGQVLREGDAITSLQSLDPIFVDFSLPQQRLSLLAPGIPVRLTTDAAPGDQFQGTISAISPRIDPATRAVRIQATVDNTSLKLRGGMFANVEIVLPNRDPVNVIPLTAVLFAPFGDSVFVVEPEVQDTAAGAPELPAATSPRAQSESEEALADTEAALVLTQRFVRLGERRGDFVAVVKGLNVGEQIATSGVFKLRTGARVVIDNALAPGAELVPKPVNQ